MKNIILASLLSLFAYPAFSQVVVNTNPMSPADLHENAMIIQNGNSESEAVKTVIIKVENDYGVKCEGETVSVSFITDRAVYKASCSGPGIRLSLKVKSKFEISNAEVTYSVLRYGVKF